MAGRKTVRRKPLLERTIISEGMLRSAIANEEVFNQGLNRKTFELWLTPIEKAIDDGDAYAEPGVEYQMATRFLKNLRTLALENPKRPILIHMKTNGGYWEEGMAIYDALEACPNPLTILSYTHARSMSSIIFQAADIRVMMPHSYFLFHEGYLGLSGTNKGVMSNAEWNERIMGQMLDVYVKTLMRTGGRFEYEGRGSAQKEVQRLLGMCMKPDEASRYARAIAEAYRKHKDTARLIREMLVAATDRKEDVFLTPAQAVDWGFADFVFGQDGKWDWTKLRPEKK